MLRTGRVHLSFAHDLRGDPNLIVGESHECNFWRNYPQPSGQKRQWRVRSVGKCASGRGPQARGTRAACCSTRLSNARSDTESSGCSARPRRSADTNAPPPGFELTPPRLPKRVDDILQHAINRYSIFLRDKIKNISCIIYNNLRSLSIIFRLHPAGIKDIFLLHRQSLVISYQ